jgi:hypothetical protein
LVTWFPESNPDQYVPVGAPRPATAAITLDIHDITVVRKTFAAAEDATGLFDGANAVDVYQRHI